MVYFTMVYDVLTRLWECAADFILPRVMTNPPATLYTGIG